MHVSRIMRAALKQLADSAATVPQDLRRGPDGPLARD
jgi:hypothetical protein